MVSVFNFVKKSIGRQHIILVIVFVQIYSASLFLFVYSTYQNQVILTAQSETKANTLKVNNAITRVKIAKAAEIKAAKDAADLKIAQEAAAKQATEAGLAISSKPCNDSLTHADPTNIDVLVNKKHCLRPVSYTPSDLVNIHGAVLSQKAAPSFDLMYQAAVSAGQGFSVTSSYRSYYNQINTYNYWISVSGRTGADTYSARPGYSEHQTGLAVDLKAGSCALSCFGSTSQYIWLREHAADFGFVQRYVAGSESITGYTSEEWHYRYVGVTVAQDMKARGIMTLEQYWDMRGGDY